MTETTLLINNKQAYHHYEIVDKLTAGMVLVGTEVKSLRNGHGEMRDAYIIIDDHFEVWLKNMTIPHYSHGNIQNHLETRVRKLLIKKSEAKKLSSQVQKKGMTIVPLAIFLNKHLIKISIGIGKGKKTFQKKEALREKDIKRDTDRIIKGNFR